MGPQTNCVFCSLEYENVEQLLHLCPKSQIIWALVKNIIGKTFNFVDCFISGNWLSSSMASKDLFTQSVIAATAWHIWKARCNKVFRNENMDCWLLAFK